MTQYDIFAQGIGLEKPWKIKNMEMIKTDGSQETFNSMFFFNSGELHIYLEFDKGSEFNCPVCGKPCKVYDTSSRVWRHQDFFQHKCFIHANLPRIDCKEHGVKTIEPSWARSGTGFTLMFEAALFQLVSCMTIKDAARILRVSDHYVWDIIGHYVPTAIDAKVYDKVNKIGIDETSIHGHHYITVFVDLDTHKVIEVIEGKDHTTVDKFCWNFHFKKGNRYNIDVITCDMSLSFQKGIKENFSLADTVIDKFHIIKHTNEALWSVWKETKKIDDSGELKHTKYLWLSNNQNLKNEQKEKLGNLKKNNLFSRLTRALMLREDVQDLFNSYISYDESDAKLKRLIKRMQMFKSLAFKKLGKMFLKNFEAIKNYFKYRLTNAILESNNTKIQKAKAQANGFRNIEYFRNIIFLKLGDLNIKDIFKTKLGLS